MQVRVSRRSRIVLGAVATGLALAQFRLIVFVFGDQYGRCLDAAHGVVVGKPHWRIYQSRILSPYLIDTLSKVLPDYLAAHVAFSIAALAVAGVLAWRLAARVGGPRAGALGLVVFHLTFALLLAKPWLYAWDYVDAIVFLVFLDFVVAERPWKHFVVLCAIGVLNHEIANFIALWLILDPLVRWWSQRADKKPLAWQPVVAGAVTLVGSFVVVELLRRALLVEQIGPKIFFDAPAEIGSSFYFTLGKNAQLLAQIFSRWDYSLPYLAPLFVVTCIALALWLGRREPVRFGALALTHVLLVGSLLAFGILLETRIYVVLIPLVVLAAAYATRDAPPPAAGMS